MLGKERIERVADALRANLRRRKQQARGRGEAGAESLIVAGVAHGAARSEEGDKGDDTPLDAQAAHTDGAGADNGGGGGSGGDGGGGGD